MHVNIDLCEYINGRISKTKCVRMYVLGVCVSGCVNICEKMCAPVSTCEGVCLCIRACVPARVGVKSMSGV